MTYVKTIMDNGNDGVLVTYVVDGKEQTVDFLETDFDGGLQGYFENATKSHSFWEYSGWLEDNPQYTYLSLNGFYAKDPGTPGTRMRVAWGARTPAANLPVGTATYSGTMTANIYQQGQQVSRAVRNSLDGSLNLTANFAQSSIEGTIYGPGDKEVRRFAHQRGSARVHAFRDNGRPDNGWPVHRLSHRHGHECGRSAAGVGPWIRGRRHRGLLWSRSGRGRGSAQCEARRGPALDDRNVRRHETVS